MDYTKNLKLSKPSYDDDVDIKIINTNMDMLDDNISNLDYVKNVQTDNNGLTFIKRNGDTIPVPLNYLPITGGNLTGDLTVNGNAPQYEIERIVDNRNEKYTLTAIKYSNGVLSQVVSCKQFTNINEQITFLIPFKDTNGISLSNGTYSLATDEYKDPYNDWVWSVANLSTTGAKFKASGYYSRPCYTVNGYWK